MHQLDRPRAPSRADLAALAAATAYVRRVIRGGKRLYAIHAADGRPLGAAPSRELALLAIRQSDLEPADAH